MSYFPRGFFSFKFFSTGYWGGSGVIPTKKGGGGLPEEVFEEALAAKRARERAWQKKQFEIDDDEAILVLLSSLLD